MISQELSAATGEFAQTIGDLSASDIGGQLTNSFAGLAEVERKAQDLQSIQSHEDIVTIMATGASVLDVYRFGCIVDTISG